MEKEAGSNRVETEIARWNGFAKALRTEDKRAFDETMDTYRRLASDNGDSVDLAAFEQLALSVVIGQMAKLKELDNRLNVLDPPKPQIKEDSPEPAETTVSVAKPPPKKTQRGLLDYG